MAHMRDGAYKPLGSKLYSTSKVKTSSLTIAQNNLATSIAVVQLIQTVKILRPHRLLH